MTKKREEIKRVIYNGVGLLEIASREILCEEDIVEIPISKRLIATFEAGRYHGAYRHYILSRILYASARDASQLPHYEKVWKAYVKTTGKS